MAAIGWNAVRLLVSWSRIEPSRAATTARYLDLVAATVRRLSRHGIYTIVDLHQDAWGPALAARPGEACEPPTLPALGWDGAPAWATLDGGAARCFPPGTRELSPAVRAAWQAFFTDAAGPGGVGIQTRYVRMLRRVARRFARSTAVAGFDLMNEPNAIGAAQQAALSAFYARALDQIRAGERAGRGRRHLVLFEPSVLWSAFGNGAPPDFDRDRDVVYAPHIYTGGFTNGPIPRAAFATARREARGFGGAPVLSGEWGTDPRRAGKPDRYFLRHQALQDSFRMSATLWTWRESCGDPHKVADVRQGAGAAGLGRLPGRLPDEPGHAPAPRADPRAQAGLRARRARPARAHALHARGRARGVGPRAAPGRAARGLPAARAGPPRRRAGTSTCPPTA